MNVVDHDIEPRWKAQEMSGTNSFFKGGIERKLKQTDGFIKMIELELVQKNYFQERPMRWSTLKYKKVNKKAHAKGTQ